MPKRLVRSHGNADATLVRNTEIYLNNIMVCYGLWTYGDVGKGKGINETMMMKSRKLFIFRSISDEFPFGYGERTDTLTDSNLWLEHFFFSRIFFFLLSLPPCCSCILNNHKGEGGRAKNK